MIDANALPLGVALVVSLLVVVGAALALIGSVGLLRFGTFFQRIHPPTMGTTLGVACVLVGSMLLFSVLESRPVVHEIVIAVFMVVTTPVTFMLLVRAARYREAPLDGDPTETRVGSTRASGERASD